MSECELLLEYRVVDVFAGDRGRSWDLDHWRYSSSLIKLESLYDSSVDRRHS